MLTLPIKKKWFDMIASGEKYEEYREIKPYYCTRFKKLFLDGVTKGEAWIRPPRRTIRFRNGYSSKSPMIEAECTMHLGNGVEEWGAEPGKRYIILTIYKYKIIKTEDENDISKRNTKET